MDTSTVPPTGQAQQQPRARRPHRPRKDYTNLDTVFESLDDLKTALRQYMDNATTPDALPQYVSCAMTLSTHATLPLKSLTESQHSRRRRSSYAPFDGFGDELDLGGHDVSSAVHEQHGQEQDQDQEQDQQLQYKTVLELVNIDDLKQRQTWQRAAAKGIVHQIQDLDGFKYCFNNNWSSKDDNGYRYSYTCLDSLENKDRHANGFRATNAATRRPGANTRGVRKPTYDCKGQIAVKFSAMRQSVEVVYKHHAIHKTVAERRPPPRKDSKRKSVTHQPVSDTTPDASLLSFADQDTHENSFILHDMDPSAFQQYPDPKELPVAKKPPRKVKDSAIQPRSKRQKIQSSQPTDQAERPLSLVEILQQSMASNDTSTVNHDSNANPSPSSPPPPPLWQNPPSAIVNVSSSALSGSYAPLASRPSFNTTYQQQQPPDVGRFSKLAVPCFKCKAAHTQGSAMVCNLFVIPASYEEPSATILRSSDLTRHQSQIRAGYKLTGVFTAITGVVAISGNASTTSSDLLTIPTIKSGDPLNDYDQVWVSAGVGEHCNITAFDNEIYLLHGHCRDMNIAFTTLRSRVIEGKFSVFPKVRCVLATFGDASCTNDGAIIQQFSNPDDEDFPIRHSLSETCLEVYTEDEAQRTPARSMKWACGEDINDEWVDPFDNDDDDHLISARSVDAGHRHDHVTVAPADGPNCNSAQHRDTDTKVQGHCHSFKKPFFSLSASIKRADHSKVGGSEPCSVLVFSDNDCKKDGAEIVDLNNTGALGVCHNVTLHNGNDFVTPIAGHSWKWVCGRQQIDECIHGAVDSGSETDTDMETTTVKKGKTLTVTATTSLACSLTTEAAHSVDVVTSVITHKPVTHTITSVFTKTQLRVRTKLITSVATAISTVHYTLTKPFSTTYKVCDAQVSSQS
ncbi:hypothetical protein QM012_000568 [Aureobasidium pullulans]|uniref:Uncharacterized protein n=1 Tax=Aureobasidium pullulans TaxID=5580 RepID=A0ABR0TXE6_AURPU